MRPKDFKGLSAGDQKARWEARVHDPRPRVQTGFPELDELLNRGGLAPGELVVLGGRTHTRKSTVMLNITERLLRRGVPVGFCGLDEPTPSYIAKLASVFLRVPHAYLEEEWDESDVQRRLDDEFWPYAQKLSVTEGYRPTFDQLTEWLEVSSVDQGGKSQVVFIDYVSLLSRDKFHGQDVTRVPRLFEELQVWTNEQEVVTIALHQVARGAGDREHLPMTLENLRYGGEEFADIVFGTYRPALEQLGNLSADQAEAQMGEKWDEEKWEEACLRVKRFKDSTFLQLLKNRPGVHLLEKGIELLSPTTAMYMEPADRQVFTENTDPKVVSLHG